MAAFRPPVGGGMHGALCPFCLNPHFPFCSRSPLEPSTYPSLPHFGHPRPPIPFSGSLDPVRPLSGAGFLSESIGRSSYGSGRLLPPSNALQERNPAFQRAAEGFSSRLEPLSQAMKHPSFDFQSAEAFYAGPSTKFTDPPHSPLGFEHRPFPGGSGQHQSNFGGQGINECVGMEPGGGISRDKAVALPQWSHGQQRRAMGMVDTHPLAGSASGEQELLSRVLSRIDDESHSARIPNFGVRLGEHPSLPRNHMDFPRREFSIDGHIREGDERGKGSTFKRQKFNGRKADEYPIDARILEGDERGEGSTFKRQTFNGRKSEWTSKHVASPLVVAEKQQEIPADSHILKTVLEPKSDRGFSSSEQSSEDLQDDKKEMDRLPGGDKDPAQPFGGLDAEEDDEVRSWDLQSVSSDSTKRENAFSFDGTKERKPVEDEQGTPQMQTGRDDSGDRIVASQQRMKEPLSREEELLIEHGLKTPEREGPISREDQLLVERALQSTLSRSLGATPWEQQPFREQGLEGRILQPSAPMPRGHEQLLEHRWHNGTMENKRRPSREEELLIEHGLLDDSSREVHHHLISTDQMHALDGRVSFQDRGRFQGSHEHSPVEILEGQHNYNPRRFHDDKWAQTQERPSFSELGQLPSFEKAEQHVSNRGRLDGETVHNSYADMEHRGPSSRGILGTMPQKSSRENIGVKWWDNASEKVSPQGLRDVREEILSFSRPAEGSQDGRLRERALDVLRPPMLPPSSDGANDLGRNIYSRESSYTRGWLPTDGTRPPLLETHGGPPVQEVEQHFAEERSKQRLPFQQQQLVLRAEQQHATALKTFGESSWEMQQQQSRLHQTPSSESVHHLENVHLQHQSQLQQQSKSQRIQMQQQNRAQQMPELQQPQSYLQYKNNVLHQSTSSQPLSMTRQSYPASYTLQEQSASECDNHFVQQSNIEKQLHLSPSQFQQQRANTQQPPVQLSTPHQPSSGLTHELSLHQQQSLHHSHPSRIQQYDPLLENLEIQENNLQDQRKLEVQQQQQSLQSHHQRHFEHQMRHLQQFPSQLQHPSQLQQQPSSLQTKQIVNQILQRDSQFLRHLPQQMQEQKQQSLHYLDNKHHQQQSVTSLQSGQSHSFQSTAQIGMTPGAPHDRGILLSGRSQDTGPSNATASQVLHSQRVQQQPFAAQVPSVWDSITPRPVVSTGTPLSTSPLPPPPLPGAPLPPYDLPPPPPPPPLPPLPPKFPLLPRTAVSDTYATALPPTTHMGPAFEQKVHTQNSQFQKPHNFAPQHRSSGIHEEHSLQSMDTSYMQKIQHENHLQFPHRQPQLQEKSRIVDAVSIFRKPGRLTRPDRFVVILRGLPGSGKSYLAKALRDVEVLNGGSAPRIHSMDDYFMAEVEKVEGDEHGTSSMRGKKTVKRVMEYCYEPDMEEAYRASMFKAFRKTLEEGMFTFVIVDDRNILVADFTQFWAIAKRSGYEVYILEAPYRDPMGCAARNVHGFTVEQVRSMADRWESTPPIHFQMDISSLFRGDDLNAEDITEVEMDAEDMECDMEGQEHLSPSNYTRTVGGNTAGGRWEDGSMDNGDKTIQDKSLVKRVRADHGNNNSNSNSSGINIDAGNALSGLMKAYGKRDKSVHWADFQGGKGSNKGFSIGVVLEKKGHLVIGPGPGYNETSNPAEEAEDSPIHNNHGAAEVRRNTKFLEQLRAEQEAFKAVFARRRHRIGGIEDEDD